jgi:hypothetical protein
MACGLLWLTVIAIITIPKADRILRDGSDVDALGKAIAKWPTPLAVPAAFAAAFMIGTVAAPISIALVKSVGSRLHRGLGQIDDWGAPILTSDGSFKTRRPRSFFTVIWRLERSVNAVSVTTRSLIGDTILNVLSRAGVPGGAGMRFPTRYVISSLEYSAPQLSVNAPTQYQEYDRYKSEAEFRCAVVPALISLAIVVPLNGRWLVVLVTLLGSAILLIQAVAQTRAARNVLANAAYLDQVTLPAVQSVADVLKDTNPSLTSEGEWVGAMIEVLARKGLFEVADDAVQEVLDSEESDTVEAVAIYLKDRYPPSFELMTRLMAASRSDDYKSIAKKLTDDASAA